MKQKPMMIGSVSFSGTGLPLLLAGPCVIESGSLCKKIADRLAALSAKHRVDIVFKASYDKANRLSLESYRGPGLKKGLDILKKVKEKLKVPVLSDVHCVKDISEAAKVLDIIQIPAFLCRQTDLLLAAGKTGRRQAKRLVNYSPQSGDIAANRLAELEG